MDLIKNHVINFLRYDYDQVMLQPNIQQSLSGWRQLISDMSLTNELFSVMSMNLPDLNFRKL